MNYLLLTILFLAETTEPVGVPGWVPVVIGVILLLLFWWGLNRNAIPQGPAVHADDHHGDSHHEDGHHEDDHVPQLHSEPHGAHHDHPTELVGTAAPAEALMAGRETAVAITPDDLKIIEGIGPKIEGILQDAGIRTFAELAAASVSQLEQIVREDAGIRIAFPDTWPEQAALAAAGEWSRLEQLQDELKGGRRE
jgi:predicted flap endonuclease-1-like 5' DNA nuclease